MEDPGAGACGQAYHHGALPQLSGSSSAAVAVTPEPRGGSLADGEEVCGTPKARLFTSKEGQKGVEFDIGLVDPVEAVSASGEGRMCEAGETKGSSLAERLMSMEEAKGGSLPFSPQGSTEPVSLWTCHVANGRWSDNTLHVPSGKAGCSKDVRCVHVTLDKATEGCPCVPEDLIGNGNGDWGGLAELKTCMEDLVMSVSAEANNCDEGVSDSMKPCSGQWQSGVDGLGPVADANNELQQHDLAHTYSIPSVSGRIGVSVDGKAVQFHQKSDNPVTSHVADGSLRNNNCFCDPAECMFDTMGMVIEGNPREQNSALGEGVLNGGVDTEISPDNLDMHCKETHDVDKGLPDLVKLGIVQLPSGMSVTCLKKNADPNNVEEYGLLPKVVAEDSLIMHENSVPSVLGNTIVVSLDDKAGHICELSEHRERVENVTFSYQGGHTPSSGDWFSRREVEGAHDAGDLLDLGEHHRDELPRVADGLTLITGDNHELERVLPNIDPVGSCPVDEASVLSIYGSSIDAHLDEKDGLTGYVSERSSNLEKPACNSLGGDMLSCQSGLQSEASEYEKNQESSMEAFNRSNFSVCESSMEELKSCGPCLINGIQQISQKHGIPESPPNRDVHSSYKLQQLCDDKPCFSGRESSALCLGRQDFVVGGSCSLDLDACNSADDKAGSVNFVSNGNDTESQSQQLSTMLVFRRRNPKRAASSRNLRSENPDQINKASTGSRRSKKFEITKPLYQSTTSTFPNKVTRGRSDLNRSHKSSAWGSLEKLMDGFAQSYVPSTPNSHPIYLENGTSSKMSDQINLPNPRKCRSSRSSKSRCSTLSDIGHLTDELNERPAFSATAGSDASLESRREIILKVPSYTSEFTDSTNTQHLKNDLVSSAQEICVAEIHGECATVSTSGLPLKNDNGTAMLPVGFSPDSILEVASAQCESNSSASHDVILHENSPDSGALNGGSHHSIVLPTSYLGRNQAPSLMQLEQRAKTAGINENMEREQTDPSSARMNNDADKGDMQTLQKSKAVRKTVVRKQGSKKKDRTTGKNLKSRSSTQISSFEAPKSRAFSNDTILPDPAELLVHTGYPELDSCFEIQTSASQEHGNTQSHSVTDNGQGSAFHTKKSIKHKRKDANAGKKGKVRDSHMKGKGKKKNMADDTSRDRGLFTKEHSDLSPASELVFKNSGTASADLPGNIVCKIDDASIPAPPPPPPRAAWVCCDDCQKWRCIPAELADVIGETNCRWTCKDNGDKMFADCSIPQAKSNAEINAELDLSDVSADEADGDGSNSKACRAPSWTNLKTNLFLHRNRRTQSIDESMVCNCKPPQDGRMGCGDGCLNRMLNIECVKRTCPCGEQCSNQQFQRRNYAQLGWFHSGKKGYGLQLQEDVSEGRFLIEYVGEVLDIASYESRQQYYASKGQKHFYFMALNGGEVIDACTKGNLGRFINHSCSPNCRTEKWMVNGEVCIGIFAMRNIKEGEELTFDYNYVRVSGAAPQKCFCGTAKCRGYIGGDLSIVDTINQDDSEIGHFEHTVAHKDSEESMGANGCGSHGSHPDIAEPEVSTQGEALHDFPAANAELEPLKQTGATLFDTNELENSLDAWCLHEDEDVVRTPVHVSRTIESSLQHVTVRDIQSSDCLRQTPCTTEILQAPNVVNGSTCGSDSGGDLVPGANAKKRNNLKHHRNVKQSAPVDNEHILGVEGGLNNLLDRDGGISKRKDATNGYLKLLFLTAAEGDSYGGTSKSVRDLSLILDALLKTKSRAVLLDIISKNGLQMLHNILKQNRSNFHRIPILRKLLKVLEFLALKEILTSEHINGGPRFAGRESFRDSMLSLTRHNDIQVHQIARNFRDRWIPRNIARSEPTDYPHASTSAQDFRGNNMVWNSNRRKRKSRWDYQPDEHYKMVGLKFQKAYCEHGSFDVFGLMRNKMHGYEGANKYQNGVHGIVNSTESADDEAPPGFEMQERQPVQALECEVAPGLCMGRYQPSLTISYGIPIALVQHIGTPEAEGQSHQKWKVAPGVPFNPFPPLPPYPRGSPCPSTSAQISQHDGSPNMKHNSSGNYGRTTDREGRVHRTWRNGPRTRWPYSNHGRRFPSNHHSFERFQPSRPQ